MTSRISPRDLDPRHVVSPQANPHHLNPWYVNAAGSRRAAVAGAVLLAATALAGCSGPSNSPSPTTGATSAPPTAASPSRSAEISPPSLTPIPTLSNEKGIVVDTTMTACSTKPGTVNANGTIRNSGSSASDLVVVVSWVLPQGNDVMARGVAVVKNAKPGSTSDWKVSTKLTTDQTVQCVLSSRRGSL